MDDLIAFFFMLLFEFKLAMAVLTALSLGLFVAELWPFGGDRVQVLNATIGIAMLIGTLYWLYRHWMKPSDK
jgi:hypothetical protein